MGEVLIKIWLKSISELLHKQMNAQKEFEKTSGVHTSSRKPPQAHKKVWDENERVLETKKKRRTHKNVLDGRSELIGCLWKTV